MQKSKFIDLDRDRQVHLLVNDIAFQLAANIIAINTNSTLEQIINNLLDESRRQIDSQCEIEIASALAEMDKLYD